VQAQEFGAVHVPPFWQAGEQVARKNKHTYKISKKSLFYLVKDIFR